MKYETVIFDLDGTLLDTLADLTSSVNHVMDNFGYPRRTAEEVRSFVGNGILNLITRCVPGHEDDPHRMEAYELYKSHYAANCLGVTKPYPGVRELCLKLRDHGVKMAVVSNKFDVGTKALVAEHFSDVIGPALGEREDVARKPSPDAVFEVIETLGADPAKTVYVGDSDVDIQTARNAGIDHIIVTWGFRGRAFLEGLHPQHLTDTADEVFRLIAGA